MATNTIERTAKELVLTVQEYSLFAFRALMNLFSKPRYWTDVLVQSDIIGVGSAAIVLLSGFFTGGVLALQSAATLAQFGAAAVTGRFVSITMLRELGRGAMLLRWPANWDRWW
jgi:phospholipid/cholesterol/gamma-HCH transport system permease protein